MKHINIHCDVAQANEIIEILEKCNISGFQIIDKVKIKNRKGNPRMGNAVWPGYNVLIMTQIREEEKITVLINKIKDYNANVSHTDQLITLEGWNIDTFIF
ncbi:MAG TPA: hypothetical protein PLS14_05145 [Bacteroidales bacterium]|nr:hypothetical protein [Bacteroidales bacterium]HPZ61311.1 hypothetical protein [Bacteroidales bacterium]HQD58984.1 hypothetical protein [Bacteroidales bacterium]